MTKLRSMDDVNVRSSSSSFDFSKLPDLANVARTALAAALDFTASKLGVDNEEAVFSHMRQGSSNACSYFNYALAKQLGAQIADLDKSVKAVHYFDHDATPEDSCFSEARRTPFVQLLVWAPRKTAALTAIGEALDRALRENFNEVVDIHSPGHILDLQVVDDSDIENRTGYGALLSSAQQRPIQVWKR